VIVVIVEIRDEMVDIDATCTDLIGIFKIIEEDIIVPMTTIERFLIVSFMTIDGFVSA